MLSLFINFDMLIVITAEEFMKKIAIITDDNAGFTPQELKELGIYAIKMPVIVDGVTKYQNEQFSEEDFYNCMSKDADIRTSQPAPGQIIELWEELLKTYDQIVQIPMSSGLSEECHNSIGLSASYPGKVFVADNHRVSVSLKQSVYDAIKLRDEGKSAEEIVAILNKEAHESTIYIMVDTLKYLKKGGRVTPAGAAIGSVLHVKPVLSIFGEKLDAYKKAVGSKKAKQIMIDAIKHDVQTKFKDIPYENLSFAMAYTHNLDDALELKKEFATALNIKEEDIMIDPLSLSVATHIGPGALALAVTKKL